MHEKCCILTRNETSGVPVTNGMDEPSAHVCYACNLTHLLSRVVGPALFRTDPDGSLSHPCCIYQPDESGE